MLTFFRGIEDTVNSRKTGGHAAAMGAVRDGEKFDILVAVACHKAKPDGFIPPFFLQKKMAAGFFIFPRHSERLFEEETSEFGCEMKF